MWTQIHSKSSVSCQPIHYKKRRSSQTQFKFDFHSWHTEANHRKIDCHQTNGKSTVLWLKMGSNQNCQKKKRKRYLNRFEMISYDFKNRVLQIKVVSAHALFAIC